MKNQLRPILTVSDGDSSIQLRHLTLIQLKRIDMLVETVGNFGEVRLIIGSTEKRSYAASFDR